MRFYKFRRKLTSKYQIYTKLASSIFSKIIFFIIIISHNANMAGELIFNKIIIENTKGGRTEIADIDGDGFNDILLHIWGSNNGNNFDGSVVWYKYPNWEEYIIDENDIFFGDEIIGHDLDNDDDVDVITCKGNYSTSEIWLYENPGYPSTAGWIESHIGTIDDVSEVKDIEIFDMNEDSNPDVVVRTKKKVTIFFYVDGVNWIQTEITIRPREGMLLADLDSDGKQDIVLNGVWLKNPIDPINDTWEEFFIDQQWFSDDTGSWQDFSVMVTSADFDNDGKIDIAFSQSEKVGFYITWYKNIDPLNGESGWIKNQIEIVDYCHTLETADFDSDGDIDILAGTLKRSSSPKILVLNNDGNGNNWTSSIIESTSAYRAKIGDIDNDGDIDFSTARSWEDAPVQIWQNNSEIKLSLTSWERHLIDVSLNYNVVTVGSADIDGDGLNDIFTGGWWYKNPGLISDLWLKKTIGVPLNNAVIAADFDSDGDIDLFGSQNSSTANNNSLAWAENDGNGNLVVQTNVLTSGSGDFLQGQVYADFGEGDQIILSWHNGGGGLQSVSVPDSLTNDWSSSLLTSTTLSEFVSAGDIDKDGDLDLLIGTIWLENNNGNWIDHTIGTIADISPSGEPDRNKLIDIDNDTRLDAVIGLEGGTQIIWFQAPDDPTQPWNRNIIGYSQGEGFSLDAADFDSDGDVDIVVGEHKGTVDNRVIIFENLSFGTDWNEIIIDSDSKDLIDHHNGTQVIDIDSDGDLDIISIGWNNKKLWIYENKALNNVPIPVELASFSVTVSNKSRILNWNTATELNNYGFDIERKIVDNEWENIGFVEGAGNSTNLIQYSFIDTESISSKVQYRLKQVDFDGSYEYSNTVKIDLGLPTEFRLSQNYPNPFNPTTTINFTLPETAIVKISVYNIIGEKIIELINGQMEAGYHNINFNGNNLSSGFYFYKLETIDFSTTKKMMLLK